MACPRCEGSGKCVECQGTGRMVCPVCLGAGEKQTPRGLMVQCKNCRGEGSCDCPTKCSSCDGAGEITSTFRKSVQDKYVVKWDNLAPLRQVVTTILIVSALLVAASEFTPEPWRTQLLQHIVNNRTGLVSGQIWRLLVPVFWSGGVAQLFANAWFLWNYGPALEGLYGSRRFLAIFLGTGIFANLVSWAIHCGLNEEALAGGGLSSPMAALAAIYLALHFRYRLLSRAEANWWIAYLVAITGYGFAQSQVNLGFGWSSFDNYGQIAAVLAGVAIVLLSKRPSGH